MTRLTEEWTETLDEAFGAKGTKGRVGEEFLAKMFDSWGWEWRRNESDRKAQLEGRDIEFKAPQWARFISADVKNNMDQYGTFEIHKDWLFKVKCDRIFHVNPETGWVVWYGVENMRRYYDNSKEKMVITTKNRLAIMSARKVNV